MSPDRRRTGFPGTFQASFGQVSGLAFFRRVNSAKYLLQIDLVPGLAGLVVYIRERMPYIPTP